MIVAGLKLGNRGQYCKTDKHGSRAFSIPVNLDELRNKVRDNVYIYIYIYIYIFSLNAAVATPSFTLYAIFRQMTDQVLLFLLHVTD